MGLPPRRKSGGHSDRPPPAENRQLPAGGKGDIVGNGFGQVKDVGLVLFRDWLLPFEIVSILLLVALVGAVVLAGKKEKIQ